MWADLAYELNWSSADINQLKAKAAGSSIEACFMLLKSWQQEDLTGDKLILVMSDAGFVEEAEQAANVLGQYATQCSVSYLFLCEVEPSLQCMHQRLLLRTL